MGYRLGFGLLIVGGIVCILPLQSLLLDPFVTSYTFAGLITMLVAGLIMGIIGMKLIFKDKDNVERRQLDFS